MVVSFTYGNENAELPDLDTELPGCVCLQSTSKQRRVLVCRGPAQAGAGVHKAGSVTTHSLWGHGTHFQVATCGFVLRILCVPPTQFQ